MTAPRNPLRWSRRCIPRPTHERCMENLYLTSQRFFTARIHSSSETMYSQIQVYRYRVTEYDSTDTGSETIIRSYLQRTTVTYSAFTRY